MMYEEYEDFVQSHLRKAEEYVAAKIQAQIDRTIASAFYDVPEVELPWCDVCQKPVERLRWYKSFSSMEYVYEAFCHGDTERTEISYRLLLILKAGDIEMGVAFKCESKELENLSSGRKIESSSLKMLPSSIQTEL